jgi:tRNA(Arg) A34 adenosine deaminase TadA
MKALAQIALAAVAAICYRRQLKVAEQKGEKAAIEKAASERETHESDFHFLDIVLEEAKIGLEANHGGPFGAIIVQKDTGEIISRKHNAVLLTNDPTAHAEMLCIQEACKKLDRLDLSDCEIFTSCEPCPMSFAAIFLSRLGRLVYGASSESAIQAGFDGNNISDALRGSAVHQKSTVKVQQRNHPKFHELFQRGSKDITPY